MLPGKLFAAFLAVAAVGVAGSPAPLEKRDALGQVNLCIRTGYAPPLFNRYPNNGECINSYWAIHSFQIEGSFWCNLFS
jgi:hypothetical protein